MEKVKFDRDILQLFLTILHQRLIIVDDLEYLNQKKNPQAAPFLSPDQLKFISDLFNRIAYRIFQSEASAQDFPQEFRDCLS